MEKTIWQSVWLGINNCETLLEQSLVPMNEFVVWFSFLKPEVETETGAHQV